MPADLLATALWIALAWVLLGLLAWSFGRAAGRRRPRQPLQPQGISALIRDPVSGYYPTQIGVYCDGCGFTVLGDYLVHESQDRSARLGVARAHLAATEGWTCDASGDWCPSCHPTPSIGVVGGDR
ncbi:hypothetical protein [Actinomadura gamaensis]|uniref:Uncharacterized protein n=1 Tax=Actinomadura gamaensis TaxID=1763541 RepID=A0ABV9U9P0_9ACTN